MDAKKVINPADIRMILNDLFPKITVLQEYIAKYKIIEELNQLEIECAREDLWSNNENASRINQLLSQKKRFLDDFKQNHDALEFLQDLLNETHEENINTLEEILAEAKKLSKSIDSMYIQRLFSDKYDDFPCFITITAGSGGLEAQDWAGMLFSMYYSFGKHHDEYKIEVIDYSDKDVGIKSAVLRLSGSPSSFPYGRLKGETGVHRLVRPSPFNANNNRHTSFASVIVSPEIDDTISITISESDLRIDTYRASGAGGQHVNKTDSAVRITHVPTGIVVQCQNDRSQHRNKAEAMKMLKSRLYMLAEEQKKAEIQSQNTQKSSISWGNQIRSYVLDDSRVKDLRTGIESPQPDRILAGEIDEFLDAYIKWSSIQ